MGDFEVGDHVEVIPGISNGWYGGYTSGDVGEILEIGGEYLYVNFGGYREYYKVRKKEVTMLYTSLSPVMRRILILHKRQFKHPYLTKEHYYG